jgi:hypothetical protein
MHQHIATVPPPWVQRGVKTMEERCMEWEGQRWLTPTHLYLFKYTDLWPPWFQPVYQVFYSTYKLPEDPEERQTMLAVLSAEPEMNWKPFLTITDPADPAADAQPSPQTRFVLVNQGQEPVLLETQ